MTNIPDSADDSNQGDPAEDLQNKVERLEAQQKETRRFVEQRLILAELKVEAVRSGIVDLDGLKFLDITLLKLQEDGNVTGGAEIISQLKRAKPWLFSAPSSSSQAKVPPAGPTRQKLATEMSSEEYRIARANIIKRTTL
jgi:hypothetical protein